jgi:hypothetical protein
MGNNSSKDQNYVSVWFWFFAIFVMALPCINVVMILVWALLMALGFASEIAPWAAKQIETWRKSFGY